MIRRTEGAHVDAAAIVASLESARVERSFAFLDLCGRAPASSCAFSAGSPADTRARFATQPINLGCKGFEDGLGSPHRVFASGRKKGHCALGGSRRALGFDRTRARGRARGRSR